MPLSTSEFQRITPGAYEGLGRTKNSAGEAARAVCDKLGKIDPRLLETVQVPMLAIAVPVPAQPSPVERLSANRTAKLPPKKCDLANYFDQARLTYREREVMSLHFEHEVGVAEIGRRLGRHHSTIQETIERAKLKMDNARTAESRAKRRAIHNHTE